jgi:hypothetical protein
MLLIPAASPATEQRAQSPLQGALVMEKESLTPERRQQLGDLLRERVKRLQ